jgi:hypothetical protein
VNGDEIRLALQHSEPGGRRCWPAGVGGAAGEGAPRGLEAGGAELRAGVRGRAARFRPAPGTRLSLVRTGVGRAELRTLEMGTGEMSTVGQSALVAIRTRHGKRIRIAGGHVLAGARDSPSAQALRRDGRTYRLSRVTAAQRPAVLAQVCDERPDSGTHLQGTGQATRTRPDGRWPSTADESSTPHHSHHPGFSKAYRAGCCSVPRRANHVATDRL